MFPKGEPAPYIVVETQDTIRHTCKWPSTASLLTLEETSTIGPDECDIQLGSDSAWQLLKARGPDYRCEEAYTVMKDARQLGRRISRSAVELASREKASSWKKTLCERARLKSWLARSASADELA